MSTANRDNRPTDPQTFYQSWFVSFELMDNRQDNRMDNRQRNARSGWMELITQKSVGFLFFDNRHSRFVPDLLDADCRRTSSGKQDLRNTEGRVL